MAHRAAAAGRTTPGGALRPRVLGTGRRVRDVVAPEMGNIKDFGAKLYDTVFAGPVGTCLVRRLPFDMRLDAIRQFSCTADRFGSTCGLGHARPRNRRMLDVGQNHGAERHLSWRDRNDAGTPPALSTP